MATNCAASSPSCVAAEVKAVQAAIAKLWPDDPAACLLVKTTPAETVGGGTVVWLTLNRPRTRNALSWELVSALHLALDALAAPSSALAAATRVVVLQGVQDAGFCSGADLKAAALGKGGVQWETQQMRCQRQFSSLIAKLHRLSQPVIASVSGAAAGGGMSLALACDVRVADSSARFIPSFVHVGLSGCEMGTSYFLPRIIGHGRARATLLTGRAIAAQEALQIGLVSEVVAASGSKLHEATARAVGDMLKVSPLGLRLTKQQLNRTADGCSLENALAGEDVCQVTCLNDDECREVGVTHTLAVAQGRSGRAKHRSKL